MANLQPSFRADYHMIANQSMDTEVKHRSDYCVLQISQGESTGISIYLSPEQLRDMHESISLALIFKKADGASEEWVTRAESL